VYEKQIAQDVSVNQQSLILGSVFEVQVTAKGRSETRRSRKKRSTRRSMCSAKTAGGGGAHASNATCSNRESLRAWRPLGGFGGVADRLNSYNHYLGTPDFLAADIARYEIPRPNRFSVRCKDS